MTKQVWHNFDQKCPLSLWKHTPSSVHSHFYMTIEKNIPIYWALLWTYYVTSKKKLSPHWLEDGQLSVDKGLCLCGRTPANLAVKSWFLWLTKRFSCPPVDCSILLNVLLCQVHLPTCLTLLQPRASLSFPPVESAKQGDLNAVSTNKDTYVS